MWDCGKDERVKLLDVHCMSKLSGLSVQQFLNRAAGFSDDTCFCLSGREFYKILDNNIKEVLF